jgi:type IX secretion system PorP/SprF family membrane protein
MNNRLILILVLLGLSVTGKAQSYHFSQFYSTPLLINPAFTGNTEGPYRAATNFRSQWTQGSTPYLTGSVSFDFNVLRKHIPEGDKAGMGIYLMNDQSLGGVLQTNSVGFSTACTVSLDEYNDHSIGAGLQGIYNQRRIDYSRLSFENQFGSNGFDPALPVGEPLNVSSKGYFDMNAGLLYHYRHDYNSFFGGFAIYNVLSHKENMLAEEFSMPVRYTFLAGGSIAVGYDGTLYTSLNYMDQAKAKDITIGMAYGIQIGSGKKQELYMGLWHRLKDAVIPYLGYLLNGFQFGLSYDYTVSKVKTSGAVRNGYELTLLYTAEDKTELKRLIPWY